MNIQYYEIHVTIGFNNIEMVRKICKLYDFEPPNNVKTKQCTGKRAKYSQAVKAMIDLCEDLNRVGYRVYRRKIEAVLYDERL